jgi:hypothetical protein
LATGVRRGWIGDRSMKLYRHTVEMEEMIELLLAEMNEINDDV